MHRTTAATPTLVRPSRPLLLCFAAYLHWYIGRHFRAMRLANGHRFPQTDGPLIVYSNHASWWDPLTFVIISRRLMPAANHYVPMDATALAHYGFFKKLGIFPVETGSAKGAAQFLRAAREIFAIPDSILWITPEGRFTDVRTRPSAFRPGMAALVARLGACTMVPLATEYTFWDERFPEILLSCGEPIRVAEAGQHTPEEWNDLLAASLTKAQDELALLSLQRDPAKFATVLGGRAGIGVVYDAWQRVRALLRGRIYRGSHAEVVHKALHE
jgi:1-acyl-sn-glycerol-3-phosphate acyltransferase